MRRITSVLAILALCFVATYAQPASDLVTSLPDLLGKMVPMYSGYVNLPGTQKYYHYLFVPSTGNPSTDPVVLWLNGGPGCSSLDGFFYEHGPYQFGPGLENITLVPNPHAWTQVASVLYLESPVGVGYTYSNNLQDYFADDESTANDNLNFLLQWFKNAPAYQKNPFFVFGESYAGVYVPTLAAKIVQSNQAGKNMRINLVGIGSGNPVTNTPSEGTLESWVPFTYGHGLMSPNNHEQILSSCPSNPDGFTCQNALNNAQNGYDGINPYWVYGTCFNPSIMERVERVKKAMLKPNDPIDRIRLSSRPRALAQVPCIDSDNAINYLNRPVATSALHVLNSIRWTICSNTLTYTPSGKNMIPNYQLLLKNSVRVLVYSGDADSVVNYVGTAKWVTQEMGLSTPTADWQPWNYNDGPNGAQVGGWKTVYNEGITFATVRGSGHMIAQFTPARSLHLFKQFLANKNI